LCDPCTSERDEDPDARSNVHSSEMVMNAAMATQHGSAQSAAI